MQNRSFLDPLIIALAFGAAITLDEPPSHVG